MPKRRPNPRALARDGLVGAPGIPTSSRRPQRAQNSVGWRRPRWPPSPALTPMCRNHPTTDIVRQRLTSRTSRRPLARRTEAATRCATLGNRTERRRRTRNRTAPSRPEDRAANDRAAVAPPVGLPALPHLPKRRLSDRPEAVGFDLGGHRWAWCGADRRCRILVDGPSGGGPLLRRPRLSELAPELRGTQTTEE